MYVCCYVSPTLCDVYEVSFDMYGISCDIRQLFCLPVKGPVESSYCVNVKLVKRKSPLLTKPLVYPQSFMGQAM